jgi:hypothetical protein
VRSLLLHKNDANLLTRRRISCGSPMLKSVSSTVRAGSASPDDFVFDAKVEKYSAYQPTPVSMSHFIDFGRNASLQSRFVQVQAA